MFEPVAMPGQSEDPRPAILLAELADWVRSEPLRALVERFGQSWTGPAELDQELAYLDEVATVPWDFRRLNGTERNQVDPDAIGGLTEELVLAAADALGLVRSLPPRHQHYDHLVLLGGLVPASVWRSAYAAQLISSGVTADDVVAISAYRELVRNAGVPGSDEPALLASFGLPPRSYEWEVMQDALRRAFGLPEFVIERESGPAATGSARFQVATAKSAEQQVTLVVAPAADPGRRANTADGYRYWADQVGQVKPGQRVLAITTCIYVPYQHGVALEHLGLPFGCSIDTVGIDFAVLKDILGPPNLRGVHYLQEIRSAIRAYRGLVRQINHGPAVEPGRTR